MAIIRNSLIVFLSLIFLTSCFDYQDVQFKGLENYNLEERTEGKVTIRLDMRVKNPNNYNIKIKKSTLDIFVNGKKLGKTQMKNDILLKKNKEDIYAIYLLTNGKELMNSAMGSLGSLLSGSIKVRIKGNVKAKVYGFGKKFPIDEEEKVNLKSMF